MAKEQRRAVRVPCNLPSSFRDSGENNAWSSYFVTVKDISRGGMRLRVHKPIPLTARLKIAFVLPNPYHKTVTEATVAPRWTSQAPGAESFDVGVRFLNMSDETKIAIQNSC